MTLNSIISLISYKQTLYKQLILLSIAIPAQPSCIGCLLKHYDTVLQDSWGQSIHQVSLIDYLGDSSSERSRYVVARVQQRFAPWRCLKLAISVFIDSRNL
jgi:hypothetical protein